MSKAIFAEVVETIGKLPTNLGLSNLYERAKRALEESNSAAPVKRSRGRPRLDDKDAGKTRGRKKKGIVEAEFPASA